MSYVDEEFAELALSRQPRYKKYTGVFKLNCRCKICGDSEKDEFLARFWARSIDDTVMLKCFNCDYSNNIANYIKSEEPDLYREYLMEKRKSNFILPPRDKEDVVKEEKKVIDFLPYSVRLDTLDSKSKLMEYVRKRKIPCEAYDKIFFTKEWQKLVNHVKPDTFTYPKDEMRLVIPIFNSDNGIESIQGRALKRDSKVKYMTVKAYEGASKVYGIERVDESKPVVIMEGPLDSLFIDNAIAITGGSLDISQIPFKGNRIWALDNEPRHPDTIKRMRKLIEQGESVVFWDKWECSEKDKDINDYIISGASREDVLNYILQNNESGLMAKLRLNKFSKI